MRLGAGLLKGRLQSKAGDSVEERLNWLESNLSQVEHELRREVEERNAKIELLQSNLRRESEERDKADKKVSALPLMDLPLPPFIVHVEVPKRMMGGSATARKSTD